MRIELINGGKAFMAQHQKIIKNFIVKNKLTPVSFAQVKMAKPEATAISEFIPFWLKYGGMVGPHFHLGGKTYLLTEDHWNKFSRELVVDFQRRLESAKSITFGDALNIDDSISMIR